MCRRRHAHNKSRILSQCFEYFSQADVSACLHAGIMLQNWDFLITYCTATCIVLNALILNKYK